ncbi:hypothetical protein AMAG_09394 [Allomyces macrogynus ATCC 38327]|uniref:Uncharacterized protein n=1 Tax=Allomyces macrogynus (strain ATCC 38327) TaxID=578462 RepID=A0A0L0SPD9_ALLM3|nr:hypothetical protein AMAG_09394 [Allomyces macrogynus ATCC 38327]|eukprot:KNE64368.1 hypothetical protein AMAG_09394 [Allomyces macrogynus ATCC 38327]
MMPPSSDVEMEEVGSPLISRGAPCGPRAAFSFARNMLVPSSFSSTATSAPSGVTARRPQFSGPLSRTRASTPVTSLAADLDSGLLLSLSTKRGARRVWTGYARPWFAVTVVL